jgi:hypothetical protein
MGFKPQPGRFGAQGPFVRGVLLMATLIVVVAASLIAWNRAGDARFDRELRAVVQEAVLGIDPDASVESVVTPNRGGSILFIDVTVDTLDPPLLHDNRLTIQSEVARELDRAIDLRLRTQLPEAGGDN